MRGRMLLGAFALLFFPTLIDQCNACSCMPEHPQTHYCKSDFVILAKVKREQIIKNSRIYKVHVRKQYKMSEKALVALKYGRIITSPYDSMCGISLNLGDVYVISGNIYSLKAHVNLCNMVKPWNSLTRRQRKGLKAMYKLGCTCNIENCYFGRGCTANFDACRSQGKCHEQEGICLRGKSKRCIWTRNKALTHCLRNTTKPLTISR